EILKQDVGQFRRGDLRNGRRRRGGRRWTCWRRTRQIRRFRRGRGRRACAGKRGRWRLGHGTPVASKKDDGYGDCFHSFIFRQDSATCRLRRDGKNDW